MPLCSRRLYSSILFSRICCLLTAYIFFSLFYNLICRSFNLWTLNTSFCLWFINWFNTVLKFCWVFRCCLVNFNLLWHLFLFNRLWIFFIQIWFIYNFFRFRSWRWIRSVILIFHLRFLCILFQESLLIRFNNFILFLFRSLFLLFWFNDLF